MIALLHDAFWSAVAALGFAVLFNVPRRALLGCMLAGALGHALRTFCVGLGLTLEISTLMGATAVGFLAIALGHRRHVPRLIFSVTGVIPMVPGVFAYQTMLGLFDVVNATNVDAGNVALLSVGENAIKTGLILAALAVGTTAPRLLFDRQKPVV
jgi:uncharacterized membrane protein YjjB (DUF3815 family)